MFGKVLIGTDTFLMSLEETKSRIKYSLFSIYHKDDRINTLAPTHPLLNEGIMKKVDLTDYVVESYIIQRFGTKIERGGVGNYIGRIIESISYAERYFTDDMPGVQRTKYKSQGNIIEQFEAADQFVTYAYSKCNGMRETLSVKYNGITVDLGSSALKPRFKMTYVELDTQSAYDLKGKTIEKITFDTLSQASDMSWYKENGDCKKNYSSVTSLQDFELRVMLPLTNAIAKAHEKNEVLLVSLDTETTGLAIWNLSKSNPDKDHCVTLQLSWEDDQGVIMYFDMEYFNNCPVETVMHRLQELFQKYDGERKIQRCNGTEVCIARDWYELIGHNIMFDRKVGWDEGVDLWFDEDTLQMAFCINTASVRGNNKLKVLTRKFFGHETPELEDILGSKNQDKFKFLKDEEVVQIYGCADTDYTRLLYKKLRPLMGDYLYMRYKAQDVVLLNILAMSEYYGLHTVEDKVKELADETLNNINILVETMHSYVGAHLEAMQLKTELDILLKTGAITKQEYADRILSFKPSPNCAYVFDVTAAELRKVLFDILKYPVIAMTEGKNPVPKTDKFTMKKLLQTSRSEHSTARKLNYDVLKTGCDRREYMRLREGGEDDQKKADGMVLISAAEFNKLEYPLALIIQKWSELNKEYTAYYKPFVTKANEGKMFYSYRMARIETRRIANPGQTLKGKLKKLVLSYNDDYYLLDFDMSQAEYRVMISLAGFVDLIEKMRDPEKDYHTETASVVNNIPAHRVSKKIRKQTKSISFGIPYGLGERSLCESIFGEVNEHNLYLTRVMINKWKENNHPVMQLLEDARDNALIEWQISEELRDFMGFWENERDGEGHIVYDEIGLPKLKLDANGNKIPIPISRVCNDLGFYRTFSLANIDMSDKAVKRRATGRYEGKESNIRRAAGNYGIQSYAAELFRIILMRFYYACEKKGYTHGDKIIWHMLIHDELLCSVHKSIHPFEIYQLVKESCMLRLKGHTNYFVGINVGNTWGECKDDAREAPVIFVNRIVKRWKQSVVDGDNGEFSVRNTPVQFRRLNAETGEEEYWFNDPFDFIKPYMDEYKRDRIGEVVRAIDPGVDTGVVDVARIVEGFDNYTVRAYVDDYPSAYKVDKEDYFNGEFGGVRHYDDDAIADAKWEACFVSWIKDQYGEDKKFKRLRGDLCTYLDVKESADEAELIEELDFEDDSFEDEVRELFDENGVLDTLYFDGGSAEKKSEVFNIRKQENKQVQIYNNQIVIKVDSLATMKKYKKALYMLRARNGYAVRFKCCGILSRWITIKAVDISYIEDMLKGVA